MAVIWSSAERGRSTRMVGTWVGADTVIRTSTTTLLPSYPGWRRDDMPTALWFMLEMTETLCN